MKKFISAVLLLLIVVVWSRSLPSPQPFQQAGTTLPTLVYLGEGAATYTVDPGWDFIVKRNNPYNLVFVPGVTYTARATERVWRIQGAGGAPPAAFHDDIVVDTVMAGCVMRYVAIDDDIDGRFNSFYLNDTLIHTIAEGMVSTGEFVIPADGVLSYNSNDSIGMYLDVCSETVTNTPQPNATDTPTPTATETAVSIGTATNTPTQDPLASPTATQDLTQTPGPSQTPQATPDLTATVTGTRPLITPQAGTPVPGASQTPHPTRKPPREDACLRINFEVGGDVARNGRYDVIEVGGRVLYSWTAQDGWKDSGWIQKIKLSYRSVYVQVLYYANDTAEPIVMEILNPAPGTNYGWLSEGMCHAIEVAWP